MRPQIYVRPLFLTPAPNAYRAEDVVLHKPTIFKKSFGVKHSVFAGAMLNKVTSQCRMVPSTHSFVSVLYLRMVDSTVDYYILLLLILFVFFV